MRKIFLKLFFYLFLILVSFNIGNSISVNISINESSTLTKLLVGSYSLTAYGVLTIYNPSNTSTVYEFDLPLNLDSLIAIEKVNSNLSGENKFDFKFSEIKGFIIKPKEKISVKYKIFGLVPYNIYDNASSSILRYYLGNISLLTNPVVNLQKPQREGYVYNDDENKTINKTPSNLTRRLISTTLKNPSDFDLIVKKISLYKTNVSEPFYDDGKLLGSKSGVTLTPYETKTFDFFDLTSGNNSVYWVSDDINIMYNLKDHYIRSYSEQKPSSNNNYNSHSGGGSGGHKYYIKTNETNLINEIFDSIILKKTVDKTIVRKNDTFEVILKIVNVNDIPIYNLTLFDFIPDKYDLIKTSTSSVVNDKTLIFKIDSIPAYGTKVIKYTLKNLDSLKGITYLYPSKLIYKNKTIYSEGVLLINDILPTKKIFVQKKIDTYNDEFDKVTIIVKNLGSVPIENILIKEDIDNDTIIKDISKMFYERGVWKIKKLDGLGTWQVSYLIEKNKAKETLPNIYGVEKSNVYGTIIRNEEVVTIYHEQPRTIEKVGMVFAVGLLIMYLLF